MKLSARFEPAPALAPAPFQAFKQNLSLLIESWKLKT